MENTENLTECAELMIATMRGVTVRRNHPPSHKDSYDAVVWLADRAAGKAVDRSVHVNLSSRDAPLPELSTDELIQALKQLSADNAAGHANILAPGPVAEPEPVLEGLSPDVQPPQIKPDEPSK